MFASHITEKSNFKTLIVYASDSAAHHTKDCVKVMAEYMECRYTDINKVAKLDVSEFDMVGFASGIYNGKISDKLYEAIKDVELRFDQNTFLLITHAKKLDEKYVKSLENLLKSKEAGFLFTHDCPASDVLGNTGMAGRSSKDRPYLNDMVKVENFAADLIWIRHRATGAVDRRVSEREELERKKAEAAARGEIIEPEKPEEVENISEAPAASAVAQAETKADEKVVPTDKKKGLKGFFKK